MIRMKIMTLKDTRRKGMTISDDTIYEESFGNADKALTVCARSFLYHM